MSGKRSQCGGFGDDSGTNLSVVYSLPIPVLMDGKAC